MHDADPLLTLSASDADVPAFGAIDPAHIGPALDRLLADAEAALMAIGDDTTPPDYDTIERVLGQPLERLERAWGTVGHLQSVIDGPALRAAHAENLPRVTDFMTRLASDPRFFDRLRTLAAAPAFDTLSPVRRKVVHDALRDFELGGAALEGAARERHHSVVARQAELAQAFGDHLLDATDAWSLVVDEHRLGGVPADTVAAARAAAAGDGLAGCKLTLHAPCRGPVMAFADDRALREALHTAHATLASELGPASWDNGPTMHELVALRQEEAALLGQPSYAALSLVPKMAGSPAEVAGFLRELATRARPPALAELETLRVFARTELGLASLEPWDIAWASEQLKRAVHGVDDESLRPYFPLPQVLDGLFDLVRTLFGVHFVPLTVDAWHADVRGWRLERDGAPLGGLLLDPYARAGKQSGAWMDESRSRWRRPDGTLQRPLATLVCNFAPPQEGRPSRLSHDEVVTLFHELGHGLHHLLTRIDERAVAGIAGVEWDAAELPSQFMESFAWQWPVLQRLSAHTDTGASLPRDLFHRLLGTRHFQAGLRLLRGIEFGLFDWRLHAEPGVVTGVGDVMALARAVAAEVAVLTRPPQDRYPHAFSHVFDGGYAAGYYGYDWAAVMAADAFDVFESHGLFDADTGRRWREEVLEVGGSRPTRESFLAFRGREPRIDSLLRQHGLA
ncbi:MAG: M3 family metallopeptidase [Rubrivivax sp.]